MVTSTGVGTVETAAATGSAVGAICADDSSTIDESVGSVVGEDSGIIAETAITVGAGVPAVGRDEAAGRVTAELGLGDGRMFVGDGVDPGICWLGECD